MATRCRIAIKNKDGSYDSIYCHNDGYLAGVGETLRNFYTTEEKVRQLLSLGDLSSLGETLEYKKVFGDEGFNIKDFIKDKGTTDYHRWRNEPIDVAHSANLKELKELSNNSGAKYIYIFNKNKWETIIIV